MAEIYTLCRGVVKGVQDMDVKFNHCQRELVARTFSHFLDDLETAFRKDLTQDDCLRTCAKALSELWRVMTFGEMMVAEWANEQWWRSVMWSSVSGSLQMHVNLLLQDFLRCLDIARIAIAETSHDLTFKIPIMDHSQSFAAIVEEACKRDSRALVRDIEALKEGRTFLQRKFGASYGLSKYILRKFKPSSLSPETRRHFSLDFHYIEMTDKCLGKGSFGTVVECKCFGVSAVAKCFDLADVNVIKDLEGEVELFATLNHVNLVQFIGYTVHDNRHMIIMERGSENLLTYLTRTRAKNKRATPLYLLKALNILLQIGQGMNYLHEHDVMHGDLKASNVIVNATEKENSTREHFWCVQVKLADYGLFNLKRTLRSTLTSAPKSWRAPEVVENKSGNVEVYTKAADVYSFAMTMFEILTGCEPFENLRSPDVLTSLLAGWRPSVDSKVHCPAYVSAYMQRCWATNPKERPLFPDICNMLLYCKGVLLRHSFPSPLSCINEYDAEILSSQLGLNWCIQQGAKDKLPIEIYSYATFDACRNQKTAASIFTGVDWVTEVMKAGRHFGNWTTQACDPEKAFKLFKMVSQGNPEALWRLGLCYEIGMGVTKNELKAVTFYERARDLNFPSAYVEIGHCYANGHGVALSIEQANVNWAIALREQTKVGVTLLCVEEMLRILAAGMSGCTLDSEIAYKITVARLLDLSTCDIGRRLVIGPESCNISLLKKIADIQSPVLKETMNEILHNCDKDGDLKYMDKYIDDYDAQQRRRSRKLAHKDYGHCGRTFIHSPFGISGLFVIAFVCLFAIFVKCLSCRPAGYFWVLQQLSSR